MLPASIAYITNRLEPKFEWFLDSLWNQCGGESLKLIVVDFHAENPDRRLELSAYNNGRFQIRHVLPKPTVWQGKHRLTKADYFAAANASNTAIALCQEPYIVFVDDVSVLMPGWFDCVVEAVQREGITCGTYDKVNDIVIEKGVVKSFTDNPIGHDIRRRNVQDGYVHPCTGQWFFGCSFVAPVESFLKINGFDEDTDGMGYQDVVAGAMLERWGTKFWFDTRMKTLESEELHHQEKTPFFREDPGQSPHDKSHRILELVRLGRNSAPNYFGEGGLRHLREQMGYSAEFPVAQIPDREWFTGKLLKELPE